MTVSLEQLKYPIGKFRNPGEYDETARRLYIAQIESLPQQMRALITDLTEEQLNRTYRPDGWTIRQVAHHVADSHMNSIIRFKLALTEDNPTIKPYDEAAWANLSDSVETPVAVSLQLLEALHTRWVILLKGISGSQWQRTVYHPERKANVSLNEFLALYAWHGEHHLEHIRIALRG